MNYHVNAQAQVGQYKKKVTWMHKINTDNEWSLPSEKCLQSSPRPTDSPHLESLQQQVCYPSPRGGDSQHSPHLICLPCLMLMRTGKKKKEAP